MSRLFKPSALVSHAQVLLPHSFRFSRPTIASEMYTPIVVGVGDVINRSRRTEDAIEPLKLMSQAIETAIKDTGLSSSAGAKLKSSIDSIDVVRCWTWPYPDLPGSLCDILEIKPKHKHCHPFNSGSTPGLFFDQASRRISLGETKVAVLTGGEALASSTWEFKT